MSWMNINRFACVALAGLALSLTACVEEGQEPDADEKVVDMTWQPVEGWELVRLAQPVESAHPYANGMTDAETQTVRAPSGSAEFKINFSRVQVERGYDFLQIYDAEHNLVQQITGAFRGWSDAIPGDTAYLAIVSDYSETAYGYRATAIQYRAPETTGEWYTQELGDGSIHTPHPYTNNLRQKWTITAIPEAQRVRIHFAGFDLERGFDFAYVYDGNGRQVATYTGALGKFVSAEVPGNVATVEIVTDYSVRRYGFDVLRYEALVDATGCRSNDDCEAGSECVQVQCIRWPCPAQCVPIQTSCNVDEDCPVMEGCQDGLCAPIACPKHYAPVCGIDGQTYGNDCMADAFHVQVAYEGECRPACEQDSDCSDDQHCEVYSVCPECVYADPPCRVACRAIGACTDGPPERACGARLGDTCEEGEYCHYELEGICGWADATGVCRPRPQVCPRFYRLVCGCDGREYSNDCAAWSAGTSVAHWGACDQPQEGQLCGTRGAAACGEGQYCHYEESAACGETDAGGTCRTTPEACTEEYAPVCGCDGRTYPNACAANQHNISVRSQGACEGSGEPRGCVVGGCSGQVCHEEGETVYTTCEWRPTYACYGLAACERQADGACGWTIGEEAQACFANGGR